MSPEPPPPAPADPADPKAEIERLKEKLKEYEAIEEDLMAQRVFEKTQKLLRTYLTIGGFVVLLSGVIGIFQVVDYVKTHARESIDKVVENESKKSLSEEADRQRKELTASTKQMHDELKASTDKMHAEFAALGKAKQDDLEALAKQQAARLQAVGQPLAASAGAKGGGAVPGVVDLSKEMGPVRDQGSESGSPGFAAAAALEYLIKKQRERVVTISPRYIYNAAREKEGTLDSDQGVTITSVLDVLERAGAVTEEAWPYRSGEFRAKPPDLKGAERFRITRRVGVVGMDNLKKALGAGYPVVGGLQLFRSSTDAPRKDGVLVMPLPGEATVGALGICFVGFDDNTKRFKFRNSWGSTWGDQGYGYASYEYVDKFLLDAWTFSLADAKP